MVEEHLEDLDDRMDDDAEAVDKQDRGSKDAEAMEEKGDESAVEDIEALRQELEVQKKKAEEYLDQWRRTAAEFANHRKRNDRERAAFTKMSNANLIMRLLPVLDDLQRALQTIPDDLHSLTWVDGIVLIGRKFHDILEREGLSEIEAEGRPFDPNLHEAVLYEESPECGEGTVISELQKGYRLHDQVLRAALVKVARAPEEHEEQIREEKEDSKEINIKEANHGKDCWN